MIIGITGTNGSGKGEVVNILVKYYGFTHYSIRDVLTQELKKQQREINRETLRDIANQLRKTYTNDILIRKILTQVNSQDCIIESIRNIDEAKYIQNQNGILIAVDAKIRIRYERIIRRHSKTDSVSFEEFQTEELSEYENTNTSSQNLRKCIEMADIKLYNNSTIAELTTQIEKYSKLFKKQ